MPLQFDTLEEIPEPIRPEFEPGSDGKFRPKGLVPATIHDEMKAKLAARSKELEQWAALGVDPDGAKKALAEREELAKKIASAQKNGKPETSEELTNLQQMVKEMSDKIAKKDALLAQQTIEAAVARSLPSTFRRDGMAVADIQLLARDVFHVTETGKVVAKGGKINDRGEPLSVEDWLKSQEAERPYLFTPSGNGGGGGSAHAGSGGKPSMTRADFDALAISNPAAAAKAAKERTITD